jgi:hypothetical protein
MSNSPKTVEGIVAWFHASDDTVDRRKNLSDRVRRRESPRSAALGTRHVLIPQATSQERPISSEQVPPGIQL